MKAWFVAIVLSFAAPALAVAQPRDISAPGTVPHAAARAGLPENVGEFRRTHVLRYGENDLSGNYDLRRDGNFMRLSLYIYPAPRVPQTQRAAACRQEMAGVAGNILQMYPAPSRSRRGEAPASSGTEAGLRLRSMHRLQMAIRGREREDVRRKSRLYCHVGGDWLVKVYASSNADFDVGEAIDAFLRSGPWPGRGPGSIAMR